MRGSLRIVRIFGIDVAVHWTFFLLFGYILFIAMRNNAGWSGALVAAVFVIAIFFCVVLHEFGHALTARRFGVQTRHITLLPIGGVAALERMPQDPVQELLVAVAGPAVNVVIAGVLLLVVWLIGDIETVANPLTGTPRFLYSLMLVNIALVVFNMLPAFPMDGGRLLRALLATRLEYVHATQIAARVGQFMAILFFMIGLLGSPILMLVAVFVFLGGGAEAKAAEQRAAIADATVRTAMISDIRVLPGDATLADAADALIVGSQHDFPIVEEGDRYLGLLRREQLVESISSSGPDTPVLEVIPSDLPTLSEGTPLIEAVDVLRTHGPTLAVVEGDRLRGMLTLEHVSEYLMLSRARRAADEHQRR